MLRSVADFYKKISQEGMSKYITNLDCKFFSVSARAATIFCTANEEEEDNCYLASNVCLFKMYEEKLNRYLRPLLHPFFDLLYTYARAIKFNKAINVNNQLLTTNLYPGVDEKFLLEVIAELKTTFPDHLLIFRSLFQEILSNVVS